VGIKWFRHRQLAGQLVGQLVGENPADWHWPFWWTLPIYPYSRRRTLRAEVIRDTVWMFDQIQGIFYVTVPIRMTVVRLDAGGLLVYAPVAPTRECVRWMRELEAQHGAVKYIILPTVSGLEHKVFAGPFARCFLAAQVYVAPHQWSFPFNLPLSWLGLPLGRTHRLPPNSQDTPFGEEFDYAILGPISLGLGLFEEVAMLHRRSRTLLLTDSLISMPEEPPAIAQLDPYPLLFHARDTATEPITDTVANRRKGWQRIALFSVYFRPSALETITLGAALQASWQAGDRSPKAYFGLYPFRWKPNWLQSFAALQGQGRPFVAPVLQTLILNRAPAETLAWVEQVAAWNFQRVIPCHLSAPLAVSPTQWRDAFAFLAPTATQKHLLPAVDFELLRDLEAALSQRGITPPAQSIDPPAE
jgi:hypothetical protein